MELKSKKEMTSLELLERINFFRNKENNKTELRHDTLLNVIRDEFQEEISLQKILESTYKNSRGKLYPMFILTLNQAKQVLMRESKFVRRAVIQYIEKLEQALIETSRPFSDDVVIESFYGDKYLDTIVSTLKRCNEIETYIEKLYNEELVPMYKHCEELIRTKSGHMISGHFCMKYGRARISE